MADFMRRPCHVMSVSEASWNTIALVPPARPASAADITNAVSLY
jgi:hypothetical protein